MSVPATSVPGVAKFDAGAVVKLLTGMGTQRGYIRPMPTFTLDGFQYDYLDPKLEGDPEDVHSWEDGKWPRVEAAVPLATGGTVNVHAVASRWGRGLVRVGWEDDNGHRHSAGISTANVRRMTASEWDIIEYHQTPENLRMIRWGKRLPGFLPE